MSLIALIPLITSVVDKILPDPQVKEEAKLKVLELAQNGELSKMANEVDLFKTEQNNITDRLKADMGSDSWLSKNIRPLSLVALFVGYFIFALMSAYGYNANESYVTLLGNWGMLVFGAYFGSRGMEKIVEMRSKK